MTDLALHVEALGGAEHGETLVLGHSLGTSAALWEEAAEILRRRFRVIAWEVPGHGGAPPAREPFHVEDLTDALVPRLDELGVAGFHYAGASVGGCVGLDLALRYAERVASVAVVSSGARLADPSVMLRRAAAVRSEGVASLIPTFRSRWFAASTPVQTVDRLFAILRQADQESYALTAEALAAFDVWSRLPAVGSPLLAVAGAQDEVVPPEQSVELARRVPRGSTVVVPHAAHSVVVEQPRLVATALTDHLRRAR